MTQEEPDMDDFNRLADQVGLLQSENAKLSSGVASSTALGNSARAESNLIFFQLETPEILQKLERFYRGEYLTVNDEGDTVWVVPEDKDLIPLNDFGVNLLMEVVTKYIDKNTVLSNYKEERIYEILADIGDELTLVIYCNYEKMGLDTAFKKSKYRLIVTTTLHLIESSYRRALMGKTSEDINQSRIVTQSDSLGRTPIPQAASSQKRSFLNIFSPRKYGA